MIDEPCIVSLTVTEKGYHRGPDGALKSDDVDLLQSSFYPFLAQAFAKQRANGLPGLTIVTCDNLADNGRLLHRLNAQYLERFAPDLPDWFAQECACPSTMVDRIVPAVPSATLQEIAGRLGMRDEGSILTEPFHQWVIEDRFVTARPRWEIGGAQIVTDVRPYETAKLRMLNGAHSALAYLGLAAGHEYVHEAVVDPALRPTIEQLMRVEAAGSIQAAPEQDLKAYADTLLARFDNPALPHRLAQIAMDGSQKIGQRWLESLEINRKRDRFCTATLTALAAWLKHVRGDGIIVDDPLAEQLRTRWAEAGGDGIVQSLFGQGGMFAEWWTPRPEDEEYLRSLLH